MALSFSEKFDLIDRVRNGLRLLDIEFDALEGKVGEIVSVMVNSDEVEQMNEYDIVAFTLSVIATGMQDVGLPRGACKNWLILLKEFLPRAVNPTCLLAGAALIETLEEVLAQDPLA